ncbi:anti-sigma factor [Luteibaculum oceani]|uniref:anti-sigma factor n=1 Tax=Luteibaculum oceani TaxID=1294296 RepID=UPI001476B3CB|nr:anti-sigma factor [Luteibaculum oceani]
MNKQELIASGLLELYALDACTTEEKALVEKLLSDPDVQKEYDEIQDSLFAVAQSQAKAPSADLKNRILSQIAEATPEKEKKQTKETPVIDLNTARPKENKWKVWFRAAAIALVFSIGGNLLLFNGWETAKKQIAQLRTANLVLAQEAQASKTSLNQMAEINNVFTKGKIHTIHLESPAQEKQSAVVFWDEKSGTTLINVAELPQIPEDKSYQLWCLIDGKPMDMGVIPNEMVGKPELTELKTSTMVPDAFAITVEPFGGRPEPTLEQLKVLGNLKT